MNYDTFWCNEMKTIKFKKYTIDANLEIKKPYMFEEVMDEKCIDTLVQNILSREHVIDNNDKLLIMALGEGIQPFGLFCDAHSEHVCLL